jgi:hypothetical protein
MLIPIRQKMRQNDAVPIKMRQNYADSDPANYADPDAAKLCRFRSGKISSKMIPYLYRCGRMIPIEMRQKYVDSDASK